MYRYDIHDQTLVDERVAQFRDQMERYRAGRFRAKKSSVRYGCKTAFIFNGMRQCCALQFPMACWLAISCVPWLRLLAAMTVATAILPARQNLQLNWPALEDVPDISADLAKVQMHAIQTSGNCIRNTTSDQFAGIANDEVEDPRAWCD